MKLRDTKVASFNSYNKAVPTTAVQEVEIGHRQSSLHCSRTLEGLIIYGLSPRNNDRVQTGNPISCILLTHCAISFGDCARVATFLGRHCLPASFRHVNFWNLHQKYDSSFLKKVSSRIRQGKLTFASMAQRFGSEIVSLSLLVIICC